MDVVLGADIVYDTSVIPALLAVVKHFLVSSLRQRRQDLESTTNATCNRAATSSANAACNGSAGAARTFSIDVMAPERAEVSTDSGAALEGSHRAIDENEPAAYFVFAIREQTTMEYFLVCARHFGYA